LGFEFQVKEMPNILKFACQDGGAEWSITPSLMDKGPGENPNMSACGFWLHPNELEVMPNGSYGKLYPQFQPQLMSGYEVMPNGSVGQILATRFFPVQDMYSNRWPYFNGSPNFKDVLAPGLAVADFLVISTPGGYDGVMQNNTPVIHECMVQWVVKKMNATVVSGHLTEYEMETLHFESNLTDSYAPWDGIGSSDYLPTFNITIRDPHSLAPNGYSTFGLGKFSQRCD
jgi:hypothetical protein